MIRLDKCLHHLGYGTRKEIKKFLKQNNVQIDGEIIIKADYKFDETTAEIKINNEVIIYQEFVYIMLNKPQDVISATKSNSHETVIDLLSDYTNGLFPVGRLDIDTVGLLLITNDGKLSHQLLSPKNHVPKTYYVETKEVLTDADLKKLEHGIKLDDELLKPAIVEKLNDVALNLTIYEGKYHQVKRMLLAINNEVTYLKRISMGPLKLDEDLMEGEWRYLTNEEIKLLNEANID